MLQVSKCVFPWLVWWRIRYMTMFRRHGWLESSVQWSAPWNAGSVEPGERFWQWEIHCAGTRIFKLARVAAGTIILEHGMPSACPYLSLGIPTSLLSLPRPVILALPLLWHGSCFKKHRRQFHLGLFLMLVLNNRAENASFPAWLCAYIFCFNCLVARWHAGFS